jgi:hypothetical protein
MARFWGCPFCGARGYKKLGSFCHFQHLYFFGSEGGSGVVGTGFEYVG